MGVEEGCEGGISSGIMMMGGAGLGMAAPQTKNDKWQHHCVNYYTVWTEQLRVSLVTTMEAAADSG